jgi:hypothetical protein
MTYAPEILGMNLAMELSGVGGSYRSARKFLQFHGFSTQFVDIHNTIDNVSTGHSAWAADAIDTYMRESATRLGGDGTARDWLRVRTGYESLQPAPGRIMAYAARYRFRSSGRSSDNDLVRWTESFHHQMVETVARGE